MAGRMRNARNLQRSPQGAEPPPAQRESAEPQVLDAFDLRREQRLLPPFVLPQSSSEAAGRSRDRSGRRFGRRGWGDSGGGLWAPTGGLRGGRLPTRRGASLR